MLQETALKILQTGANVFLTGEPGSGKTHTVNAYVRWLREHAIEPSITASTGIASTHIGGMTIHSWSGIGVRRDLNSYDLDAIAQNKRLTSRIGNARVLIIDEVSMLSAATLSMVDAVCREIRRKDEAFGGLQVVLVGDFFQLPPIVRSEGDTHAQRLEGMEVPTPASGFAYHSAAWSVLNPIHCYLHEQHRQEDAAFLAVLSAIRSGREGSAARAVLAGRLPAAGTAKAADNLPRLYAHNENVDHENFQRLAAVKGETRTFEMLSRGPERLVDTLKRSCLSPEQLPLKVGARVMFTKNDPAHSFANGTLGEVEGFADDGLPVVRTLRGNQVHVAPMEWSMMDGARTLARITQVPLRLAWAITIHKSQGMTLDAAVIDLSQAFEYGQGYVALSRLRSLANLHLLGLNDRALEVHPEVARQDREFKLRSASARKTFEAMSDTEHAKLARNFIVASGGKEKRQKVDDKPGPNLDKTREKFPNAGRSWSPADDELLKKMFAEDKSQKEMALHFGRKGSAIHARLGHLGLVEDYWVNRKKTKKAHNHY